MSPDDMENSAAATSRWWQGESAFELWVVLLMSATAVLTAWSGLQSSRWSSDVTAHNSRAAALRTDASRLSSSADRQNQIDVAAVLAWFDAVADGDEARADFLRNRFRPDLQAAVDQWIATDPLEDPDAPATPFEMPAYTVQAAVDSERLQEQAEAESMEASRAGDRSDRYVLMTVIFAVVLFFAAMSSKLSSKAGRTLTFDLALAGVVLGAIVLALLPLKL